MPPETAQQRVERIVETYSDTLLRIALHGTQNMSDAEDMVQTVFLKLLRLAPEFTDEAHEKAWLIRVMVNQCHDLQRSAARKRNTALDESLPADAPPEPTGVLDAVRSLPEKYSTIVLLYYYEGYTTPEIAKLLDMRQSTVESRLHRARAKLKNLLKGEWEA